MDTILAFLNESRQSTLFPLFQIVYMTAGVIVSGLLAGAVICRDEVKAALRLSDISHKEAAITMGISEGLLSRKLSGDKPLTFESLEKLPPIFWQAFAVTLAQRYGMPPVIEAGMALAHRNETVGAL